MGSGIYDTDILAWSEQQATLLRRLRSGERLNEQLDWDNLLDEVETVGRSELAACESLLEAAMAHLLKIHLYPDSPACRHWRAETLAFLYRARRRFSPSMRQRIDLADIHRGLLAATAEEAGPIKDLLPQSCPFSLDDLLAGTPELDALIARLKTASQSP